MQHYVAEEGVCATIAARCGSDVASLCCARLQEVGALQLDGECLALEEGLRDGSIDNPLGVIEQRVGISASCIVDEGRVDFHAEG